MGEEAFEETVLAADTGTVTIRGGYGRKKVWLGIHKGNDPEGTPDMGIFLTPRQQKTLAEAIEQMTNLAGKVVVQFTISSTGSVVAAVTKASTIMQERLDKENLFNQTGQEPIAEEKQDV